MNSMTGVRKRRSKVDYLSNYSGRIKSALWARGWRQQDLAKRIGMAPETLSRKLKNPRLFTAENMEDIRAFMGWIYIGGEDEFSVS